MTVCPSRSLAVAFPVATTAGMPYSLAIMAEWERTPPVSVIRAPILGKSRDHTGEVMGDMSTSPASTFVELGFTHDHFDQSGVGSW